MITYPLGDLRFSWQHQITGIARLFTGRPARNRMEGQLCRCPDQGFQLGRRADARQLDQDTVLALAHDRGFTGADLVHPAADDFQRLLEGACTEAKLTDAECAGKSDGRDSAPIQTKTNDKTTVQARNA